MESDKYSQATHIMDGLCLDYLTLLQSRRLE